VFRKSQADRPALEHDATVRAVLLAVPCPQVPAIAPIDTSCRGVESGRSFALEIVVSVVGVVIKK
jgi:hypothetical protein